MSFESQLEKLEPAPLIYEWSSLMRRSDPKRFGSECPSNEYLPYAVRLAAWVFSRNSENGESWKKALLVLEQMSTDSHVNIDKSSLEEHEMRDYLEQLLTVEFEEVCQLVHGCWIAFLRFKCQKKF